MLQLFLARHGQDLDNVNGILNGHRDQPLSQLGITQAHKLAEKIKSLDDSIKKSRHPEQSDSEVEGSSFDKIYSSPLQRAYETGKITAEILGLPLPEKNDLLIERNFGVLTGHPYWYVVEYCSPDIIFTPTVPYFLSALEAETFPDMLVRAKKLIDFLTLQHPDGKILLFSHGAFGKMLFAQFYHLDWQEVLKMFHFGNGDLLLLSPDCTPEKSKIFEQPQHNF